MAWEKVKLGDVCKYVTSGGTPLASRADFYNPGTIPWLKTKEVNYSRITETENYISELGLANSSAKLIPADSVIVAMYGQGDTAGRVAINKIPLCTNQACCNLVIDEKKADYEFIYYNLCTLYNKLVSLKNGGAQPNLNAGLIKNLEILVPSLKVQKRIADILSAYDDLIENNQKQIKLLEEAAQRLYKQWFIDLKFPGHETTKIVDGLPEGWRNVQIQDVCKNIGAGGTPSRSQKSFWENGNIDWFKTQELCDCWLFEASEKISEEGLKRSAAKMFPANSILMAIYASPTLGRLGILTKEACSNQAALCLQVDESKVSNYWLYLKLFELRDQFNSIARGAGQQNISGIIVKETEIALPTYSIMQQFSEMIKPFFEKQRTLQMQNISLTQTRDRLLPKLMNNEIEVS